MLHSPAAPSRDPGSPLAVMVPVVTTLALVVGIAYTLLGAADRTAVLQLAIALTFLVYFLTFVDIVIGVAVVIAGIGLSPEVPVGEIQNIRFHDFLIPALLLGWIARASREREGLQPTRITGPIMTYGLALTVSTLAGVAAETTTLRQAMLVTGKYIEYFALFLILVNTIRTEGEFSAVAVFTLLVAAASSVVGAGSFAGSEAGRIHGPAGESGNIFGGYIGLHIALAIGLFLHARSTLRRLLTGAMLLFLGMVLLYTYSRTSVVAVFVGLLAFGLLYERRVLVGSLVMLVLLPILSPATVWSRLASVGQVLSGPGPHSWQARVAAWDTMGGRTLRESPLWGRGTGSTPLGDIDNQYVHVLVESGLLGLALFAWILVRLLRTAHGLHGRLPADGFPRGFAAGYLIGLFMMFVHAVGATSFSSIRTMESFIVLTGLMVCLANRAEEWGVVPAPPVPKPAGPAPIVLLPNR